MTQMVEVDAITARVRTGAALFDRIAGPYWPDRINLDTLDVGQSNCCPAGQVHHSGDYGNALFDWGMSSLDAVRHGFLWMPTDGTIDDPVRIKTEREEIDALNRAWKIEVQARQAIREAFRFRPVAC